MGEILALRPPIAKAAYAESQIEEFETEGLRGS